MALKIGDSINIHDRCRCCFVENTSRDLWAEYICDGKIEVYGEMLIECFGLPLVEPYEYREQICEPCVQRLRDAVNFRHEVLATGELIVERLAEEQFGQEESKTEDPKSKFKIEILQEPVEEETIENIKKEIEKDDEEKIIIIQADSGAESRGSQDLEDDEDYIPDEGEGDSEVDEQYIIPEESVNSQDEDYGEVEFLDDDEDSQKALKRSRKRPYKQYTETNLRAAVASVRNGEMTRTEAAEFYNVPAKTLSGRIRKIEATGIEPAQPTANYNFNIIKEIQTILTYTNATPYRSKSGRLYCAYCPNDTHTYENPEHLRTHCKTEHAADRISAIEIIMRPAWKHEIMKIDILNLHCIFCFKPIDHWNTMFEHLHDEHNVVLDEAYNRVIPYELTSKFECCLCRQNFDTYHNLDSHMNAHYNNYVCGQCGESYITENRLKKHTETHMIANFECELCHKIFSLERYRQKHMNFVHKKKLKFKCAYCSEIFKNEYTRHLHCLELHQETVKEIKCQLCPKVFNWRPYYLKHLRLFHAEKKMKYQCTECPKYFQMKYQFKKHLQWHKGELKRECVICKKEYSSAQYLEKHYLKHLSNGVLNDEA